MVVRDPCLHYCIGVTVPHLRYSMNAPHHHPDHSHTLTHLLCLCRLKSRLWHLESLRSNTELRPRPVRVGIRAAVSFQALLVHHLHRSYTK